MDFSVIRIVPKVNDVYGVEIEHNYFARPDKPVPTGYFYFPETMGVQEAFDLLKAEMIRHRLEMIKKLTQEVLLINDVKLEDKNEKSK